MPKNSASNWDQLYYEGIHRIAKIASDEHEDLVAMWLWSEREGIFSHETALRLHKVSNTLSGQIHMTVPICWTTRKLNIPKLLILHYADLSENDHVGVSCFEVTKIIRTLEDCVKTNVRPDFIRDAVRNGFGGFTTMLPDSVKEYLNPFYGEESNKK